MPILHGDFFEDNAKSIAFHAGNKGKVPFEDRVREYIAANPGHTLEQCSKSLGICIGAVEMACANLVGKGVAAWEESSDA